MQIMILGMHRSGTSVVTRLVNMMGAWLGEPNELIGANEENPKGFWERADVIAANDALLAEYGATWRNLTSWPLHSISPSISLPPVNPDTLKEMQCIVTHLNHHAIWATKDPRLSHTLPYWLPLLEKPVFIVVHRNPLEIAISLHKRNNLRFAHGLGIWEAAIRTISSSLQGQHYHFISYSSLMQQPGTEIERLYAYLLAQQPNSVLKLPTKEQVSSFIDSSLYRSKPNEMAPEDVLTVNQLEIFTALQAGKLPTLGETLSLHATQMLALESEFEMLYEQMTTEQQMLGCAKVTIAEQEARIKQLMAERDRLQLEKTDKDNRLQWAETELQKTVALCETMQQSRWWELRRVLLREPGSSIRKLLRRA